MTFHPFSAAEFYHPPTFVIPTGFLFTKEQHSKGHFVLQQEGLGSCTPRMESLFSMEIADGLNP